ncbi:Protein kinase C signaling pathway involved MAPKK protein [Apophysomyces ossiformis]|uniref:Protein kinase C signaling pathway involved MAPKK protein n=1 Tax=Apophysomyces ossiformis TaxID=679940 RepID=A0A8H7BRA5_9FUNG|nr:Protein kinase C signaling pathway involved MAPKK protein [Apophysomyces ossiformis]
MAQIGKQKNRSGLRLDLNVTSSTSSSGLGEPSSVPQTSSSSGTWHADLVRIVTNNRSTGFLPQGNAEETATNQPFAFHDENEVDLKPEDFENIQKLGEGAAGTVWKVRHKPTNTVMAKKTITVDPDPQLQRQILRELSFLRTCRSPHIVAFYGAFLDDGDTTIAICMEYCEGGSLEDIYKRARDLQGVIGETVLAKIAESDGRIKLCDLGVSGELINSMAQTFTGTQYYMAPERIKGATYSVSSDIWSLGLTIIEVAQNRPALPPPGQPHLSIFELLDFIVRQPMPTLGGDRSEECRDFVARCLIKDPNERPCPEDMLEHPFIQRWADSTKDLGPWLKEVWGWP